MRKVVRADVAKEADALGDSLKYVAGMIREGDSDFSAGHELEVFLSADFEKIKSDIYALNRGRETA